MKTWTVVKFIEQIIDLICILQVSCQYVIGYLVSSLEKKPTFFTECRFGVISILIFDFLGRRKSIVKEHVVALQSNKSLAIWLHGLLLIWENTTYSL